jgi:hypothetical protein
MAARWQWVERNFSFDFPPEKFPDLVERVRGMPARAEALVKGVPRDVLVASDGGWSIQQNVGHLVDLGYLPMTRIVEILEGRETLTAADMSNKRTHEAGHDDREMTELLAALTEERGKLVALLESINPSDWGKSGIHPRLKTPMRIVDVVYFDAEHDDYHLARVSELKRKFT